MNDKVRRIVDRIINASTLDEDKKYLHKLEKDLKDREHYSKTDWVKQDLQSRIKQLQSQISKKQKGLLPSDYSYHPKPQSQYVDFDSVGLKH